MFGWQKIERVTPVQIISRTLIRGERIEVGILLKVKQIARKVRQGLFVVYPKLLCLVETSL